MRLKYLAMGASLLLVAACETTPKTEGAAAGAGTTTQATTTTTQAGQYRPGSQEELDATVGSLVYFDFDKSTIRPDQRPQVEQWAAWLKRYPQVTVTIEGHADERGTREYNLALGERRATSIKDTLVALGVPPGRVGTISYGKERPLVVGSNEQAWAKNRRGHLVVN